MKGIKKILVTGGAGFIGSHVNLLLNELGHQTVILDNLSYGKAENVVHGKLEVLDLCDLDGLRKLFYREKFDAVMHFAALTDVGESMRNPGKYYENNVGGSLNLLNSMAEFDVQTLIFSSTAAVYGIPEGRSIPEEHPKKPINPYGHSKLMIEEILPAYERAHGLRHCSLRYFNACGGDPKGRIQDPISVQKNLIPIALAALLSPGRKIGIFGSDYNTPDGTCVRDYIHIMDLAVAHIRGMEKLFQGKPSCAYNLGTGHGHSVRQVLETVTKVTNEILNIQKMERRPGDPDCLLADSKRALQELDWTPQYNLEEMVAHAWAAISKKNTPVGK